MCFLFWCVLQFLLWTRSSDLEYSIAKNSKRRTRMGPKFPMTQLKTPNYYVISCHRKHSTRILSQQKFSFKSLGDKWNLNDLTASMLPHSFFPLLFFKFFLQVITNYLFIRFFSFYRCGSYEIIILVVVIKNDFFFGLFKVIYLLLMIIF